jgi:hypothetical protein
MRVQSLAEAFLPQVQTTRIDIGQPPPQSFLQRLFTRGTEPPTVHNQVRSAVDTKTSCAGCAGDGHFFCDRMKNCARVHTWADGCDDRLPALKAVTRIGLSLDCSWQPPRLNAWLCFPRSSPRPPPFPRRARVRGFIQSPLFGRHFGVGLICPIFILNFKVIIGLWNHQVSATRGAVNLSPSEFALRTSLSPALAFDGYSHCSAC